MKFNIQSSPLKILELYQSNRSVVFFLIQINYYKSRLLSNFFSFVLDFTNQIRKCKIELVLKSKGVSRKQNTTRRRIRTPTTTLPAVINLFQEEKQKNSKRRRNTVLTINCTHHTSPKKTWKKYTKLTLMPEIEVD